MAGPDTARGRARAQMLADIKQHALQQLAREGAGALSLREVARGVGVVSSGIYRYYGSRDELLTALIIDAYGDLAVAVTSADRRQPRRRYRRRWVAAATAFREWAVTQPHRFQLLYGSPVPGYAAPDDTIGPAGEVVSGLLAGLADAARADVLAASSAPTRRLLRGQLDQVARGIAPALDAGTMLRATRAFAEIVGLVELELNGQFVGAFEPAGDLYAEAVRRLADQLGLLSDQV